MEEKGIKKLGHMHRRGYLLASGTVSKRCCVLQKYEKELENTQLREERSPSAPSSPFAALESFSSSTQT